MEESPKSALVDIFEGAGFRSIPSNGISVSICGQEGEIDYIFAWENLIVLCEDTTGKSVSHHFPKKEKFFNIVKNNVALFVKEYCKKNSSLEDYIAKRFYGPQDLELRFIYYSVNKNCNILAGMNNLFILNKSEADYFIRLVDTIHYSAKYEILKYLCVEMKDLGVNRLSGNGVNINSFSGFVIPSNHTHYPEGFLLVSFYADPQSLIRRACVLRRDGWRKPELSYQRLIDKNKLRNMRKHLAVGMKVYVNNLIVTLSNSSLRDEKGRILLSENINKKTIVTIELPDELGVVGVIDGQHRLFSYFESGKEKNPRINYIGNEIKKLSQRQNLLVTGIIFPENYEGNKEAFEAELFLDINKNQKSVDTSLKQDLEVLINPNAPIALARSVISRLSESGALERHLKMSQSDSEDLIAAGSLAPYVAPSIMGKRSHLFKEWKEHSSMDIGSGGREEFVEYVFSELKELLGAAASILQNKWKPVSKGGVLSTTVVAGFIMSCNYFVGKYEKKDRKYSEIFKKNKIEEIDFSKYSASQWRKLASEIYGGKC